ncbi:MAG: hypothetical protein AAB131_05735, partial [Actinomycetota bacterium]
GYIAIAAVIFGGWTLKGSVAGCVAFGLVGSFVLTIPSLGYQGIDPAFLAMAPNVVTIVAMTMYAKRVRQPAALARPFTRGLRCRPSATTAPAAPRFSSTAPFPTRRRAGWTCSCGWRRAH